MNIYHTGSSMSLVPLVCGTYRLLQIEQYWQTNPIQCCMIKNEKTHLLIDRAIPDNSYVNTKETKKLSKYKDLENEVSRMWRVRTNIVPVITGALGTIKIGLDQNLQLFAGHLSAIEPQKITLMSSAHCIWEVLGKSL